MNKTHEFGKRILFTAVILVVYMAGRTLLLYHVEPAAYQLEELDSQNIMFSMIGGDRYRYTLFALGVMPYITATLGIWIFMALKGKEFRARISPQRTERFVWIVMLIVSAAFAVSRAGELVFKDSKLDIGTLKTIAVLEMLLGSIIIYKMASLNKEHGMGGQTPILLVNILGNVISTIQKFTWEELRKPLILCVVMAVIILIMENVMIRTPVQRVSIHNTYADRSYIAFKLNPIGVMPVMFAVSFFMIPQLALKFLFFIYSDSDMIRQLYEKMNLTNAAGAAIYLGIIFILNIAFSFIMFMPGEMAEQLQKNGDSIVGVYAGKKTEKYLKRKLLLLSIFSGCVLCLLMGVPLALSLKGEIPPELEMLPSTAMILTGILCTLYQEVKTYWRFDSYSFFI